MIQINFQPVTSNNANPISQIDIGTINSIKDIESFLNIKLDDKQQQVELQNFIQILSLVLNPQSFTVLTRKQLNQPPKEDLIKFCITQFHCSIADAENLINLCMIKAEKNDGASQWWSASFTPASMSRWLTPTEHAQKLLDVLNSSLANSGGDQSQDLITSKSLIKFFYPQPTIVNSQQNEQLANNLISAMLNKIEPTNSLSPINAFLNQADMAKRIYQGLAESKEIKEFASKIDPKTIDPIARAYLVKALDAGTLGENAQLFKDLKNFLSEKDQQRYFDLVMSHGYSSHYEESMLIAEFLLALNFDKLVLEKNLSKLLKNGVLYQDYHVHLALSRVLANIQIDDMSNQDKIANLLFEQKVLSEEIEVQRNLIKFWANNSFSNPKTDELVVKSLIEQNFYYSPAKDKYYQDLVGGFLQRKFTSLDAQRDFAEFLAWVNFFWLIKQENKSFESHSTNKNFLQIKTLPEVRQSIIENIDKVIIVDNEIPDERRNDLQVIFAKLIVKLSESAPQLNLNERKKLANALTKIRFREARAVSTVAHLIYTDALGAEPEIKGLLPLTPGSKEEYYQVLPYLQITRSQDQIAMAEAIIKEKGIEFLKYVMSKWIFDQSIYTQTYNALVGHRFAKPKLAKEDAFINYLQPSFYHDINAATNGDEKNPLTIINGVQIYETLPEHGIVGTICNQKGVPTQFITLSKEIDEDDDRKIRELYTPLTNSFAADFFNSLISNFSQDNLKIYSILPSETGKLFPVLIDVDSDSKILDMLPIWAAKLITQNNFEISDYKYHNVINIVLNFFDNPEPEDETELSQSNSQDASINDISILEIYKTAIKRLVTAQGDDIKLDENSQKDAEIKDILDKFLLENYIDSYKSIIDSYWSDLYITEKFNLAYLFGQAAKRGVLGYHLDFHMDSTNKANTILALACQYCLEKIITEIAIEIGFNEQEVAAMLENPDNYENSRVVDKIAKQRDLEFLIKVLAQLRKGICIESESHNLAVSFLTDEYGARDIWDKVENQNQLPQ